MGPKHRSTIADDPCAVLAQIEPTKSVSTSSQQGRPEPWMTYSTTQQAKLSRSGGTWLPSSSTFPCETGAHLTHESDCLFVRSGRTSMDLRRSCQAGRQLLYERPPTGLKPPTPGGCCSGTDMPTLRNAHRRTSDHSEVLIDSRHQIQCVATLVLNFFWARDHVVRPNALV